ncbi:MAG TPA: DUF3267 domain-containing protein [Thermoflexus sp.]|nr:DUF3267 domain-containing protein [Thermoflexus sp.]
MRFRWGAMPTDPNFHPEGEGWHKIRGPSPLSLILYALPISFTVMLIFTALWLLAGVGFIFPLPGWFHILIFFLLPSVLLTHELLHAIGYPDFGRSDKTIIGFWPSMLMAYAHHTAPISRNRLLVVGILPFLILSVLPLMVFAALGAFFFSKEVATCLYGISVMNSMLSAGDILGEILVVSQVPASAVVRFHGWESYWKS